MANFTYPPLPSGDGLRVLTLSPGQFWDPLEGSLQSIPFSKKPKYLALSYTWGDPDSRHATFPAMPPRLVRVADPQDSNEITMTEQTPEPYITLDGQDLPLHHNATLALRFLRSPTHPLPLWVDAVCIDQRSIPERNAQVALMAFIFTRAVAVVGWLGVPEIRAEELDNVWKVGQAREIAKRFAEVASSGKSGSGSGGGGPGILSSSPDMFDYMHPRVLPDSEKTHPIWHRISRGEFVPRVQGNRYWARLWVVQEVCLPRTLAFVFGGEVWSEGAVRDMLAQAERQPSHVVPAFARGDRMPDIRRMLLARNQRFTESMRLEALVEQFMDHGCVETRDRVFGLVGLANDIDTVALGGSDPHKGSVEETISRTRLQPGHESPSPGSGKGRALIEIEYARPFHEIWMDLVSYMYLHAKPKFDFGKSPEETADERRVRLVRFAGVVQNAFEDKVEKQLLGQSPLSSGNPGRTVFMAKGYTAGTVVHLGPSYSDFVGSYREQQRWLGSWEEFYQEQDVSNMQKLREMEESYAAKLVDFTETDVSRICSIGGTGTIAWSMLQEQPQDTGPGLDAPSTSTDPVRFLGTECCLGLVPPEARPGDVIVRFWNCNAAIVVRPKRYTSGDAELEYYELVGRADIAESYKRRGDGSDNHAKDMMRVLGGVWPPKDPEQRKPGALPEGLRTKAVYVTLDFETLQKVSASIAV